MSALIEVVSVINAAAATVFDLELDVDVHTESLAGSREIATTTTGHRRLGLGPVSGSNRGYGVARSAPDSVREKPTYNTGMRTFRGRCQPPS